MEFSYAVGASGQLVFCFAGVDFTVLCAVVAVGMEPAQLTVPEERHLAILTELPFVVPFEERVKVSLSLTHHAPCLWVHPLSVVLGVGATVIFLLFKSAIPICSLLVLFSCQLNTMVFCYFYDNIANTSAGSQSSA